MQSAQERIALLVPKASGHVPLSVLIGILGVSTAAPQITKAEAFALSDALHAAGFAMEPDPRFGGPVPFANSTVTVFRQQDRPSDVSFRFFVDRMHVQIAALAASDDGVIDETELQAILTRVRAMTALSSPERVRLLAYLQHLVQHPPTPRAVAHVQEIGLEDRKALGERAVATVAINSGGRLEKPELKMLERTFDKLDLPRGELARNVAVLQAPAPPPPQVSPPPQSVAPTLSPAPVVPETPAAATPAPIALPPTPLGQRPPLPGSQHGVQLDRERLARVLAETQKVRDILSDVFENDQNLAPSTPTANAAVGEAVRTAADEDPRFPGLESRYARLLSEMLDGPALTQPQFASLARRHDLMPAGALATINEWAFEQFDEPLLDDADLIEIDHDLLSLRQHAA